MSLDDAYTAGRFDDLMEVSQIIDVAPFVKVVIGLGKECHITGVLRQARAVGGTDVGSDLRSLLEPFLHPVNAALSHVCSMDDAFVKITGHAMREDAE